MKAVFGLAFLARLLYNSKVFLCLPSAYELAE